METTPSSSLNASVRAVAKNALSSYLTLALGALLGFVLTPVLLHELGTEGFGTWALILAAANYLVLLEAGLGTATITRTAASESEGPAALSAVLSSSFVLFAIVGVAGVLATALLTVVFPILFEIPSGLRIEVRIGMFLVGTSTCILLVASVYSAALLGTGRMHIVNLKGFAVTALASIVQLVVLLSGGGIVEIALVQVAGACALWLVLRRAVLRALRGVQIAAGLADRQVMGRLLSLGWRNAVTSVAGLLAFGSDVLLVGLLLDPTAAAAYAVAFRAYVLLQRLATGVNGAVGPAHAHAAKAGTSQRRFRIYCIGLQISLAIALLGACVVGVYSEPLLELWLTDVPAESAAVLVVLCFTLVLQMPGAQAATLLLNSERVSELMKVTLAAAACNVAFSIALTLALGTLGPALGSLLVVAIVDAMLLPWVVCRMLHQPFAAFLSRGVVPLLPAAAVLGAVLGGGRAVVAEGPGILGVIALAAAAFSMVWWWSGSGREVRELLSPRQIGLGRAKS